MRINLQVPVYKTVYETEYKTVYEAVIDCNTVYDKKCTKSLETKVETVQEEKCGTKYEQKCTKVLEQIYMKKCVTRHVPKCKPKETQVFEEQCIISKLLCCPAPLWNANSIFLFRFQSVVQGRQVPEENGSGRSEGHGHQAVRLQGHSPAKVHERPQDHQGGEVREHPQIGLRTGKH